MFSKKQFGFLLSASFYILSTSAIQAQSVPGSIRKLGVDVDMRSMSRVLADEVRAGGNITLTGDVDHPGPGLEQDGDVQFRGGNVQVNDARLDNIQIFPGFRPFVRFTQSETSLPSYKKDIVATYNSPQAST